MVINILLLYNLKVARKLNSNCNDNIWHVGIYHNHVGTAYAVSVSNVHILSHFDTVVFGRETRYQSTRMNVYSGVVTFLIQWNQSCLVASQRAVVELALLSK